MSQRKKNLVSVPTWADHHSISVKTARRWIAEGRLTAYRFGPRMIRVDLNQAEELLRRIPTAGGDTDAA
jgi:excisionase family DNA binding protein